MKKLIIGLFLVSLVFLMLPDIGAQNLANSVSTVKIDSTTNTVKARDLPYNTTSQLNRLVTSTASTVVALTGRTFIEIMPCSTTTDIVVSVGVATATVTGSSGRPVTMAAPFREFLDDDIVVWVIATASQYICITQTSY